ncbi:MAG: gluconokinase [Chloroflexi bacterium]|nr:gluconokinase [Chloroflexota bacterium]
MTAVYILMGVSGCGKSTVGRALAAQLNCPFYDGDDFHSPENVAKMAGGAPLTDAEREPWLDQLAVLIGEQIGREETAVFACSALKKQYRDRLRISDQVKFVYLHGEFDLIWRRLQQRDAHYMKATMLRSQFAALEPPDISEALRVDITAPIGDVLAQIYANRPTDHST